MATVVFVHGTGVRETGFGSLFDRVRAGFSQAAPAVTVRPCFWGGRHGSRFQAGGATVPDGTAQQAADRAVARWWALGKDPLIELRQVADGYPRSGAGAERAPGARPVDEVLASRIRAACDDAELRRLTQAAGLGRRLGTVVDEVLDSEPFRKAAAVADEGALGPILAHAVVAALLPGEVHDGGATEYALIDGARRDQIVERLADLVGSDRGLVGSAALFGLRAATRLGVTRPLERRLRGLTESTGPFPGDVMLYLTRGGAAIRREIRETVLAVPGSEGPVTLLAHSLGGIACVDLLAAGELSRRHVKRLVTVGSQAPLLYEWNALPSLEYPEPLPDDFPDWINVYDRRDLLAFLANPVFPQVVDVHLDNRTPFPQAHSTYFANPVLYRTIAEQL